MWVPIGHNLVMDELVIDDQTVAQLESVVDGLVTHTHGAVHRHVIRQEVFEAYGSLARDATITSFLPVLAGRAARARIESGDLSADGPGEQQLPSVLVLDEHDCTRAQAAVALIRFYAPGRFRVASAGLHPGPAVNPALAIVLGQVGLELTDDPQALDQAAIEEADYVIAIAADAEEEAEVAAVGDRVASSVHWSIPNPNHDGQAGQAELVEALRLVDANVRAFLLEVDPEHQLHAPLLAQ